MQKQRTVPHTTWLISYSFPRTQIPLRWHLTLLEFILRMVMTAGISHRLNTINNCIYLSSFFVAALFPSNSQKWRRIHFLSLWVPFRPLVEEKGEYNIMPIQSKEKLEGPSDTSFFFFFLIDWLQHYQAPRNLYCWARSLTHRRPSHRAVICLTVYIVYNLSSIEKVQ